MEIEERLNHLEEAVRKQTNVKLMTAATLDALQQGLQEACAQLGVSEEQFLPRFQAAAQWYYDRLLGKASDAAPNLAGEIDTRTIDQIPTDERPPHIFPEGDLK
jgi:hypothetical protein